ncbi:MAG: biotin/lipoyl-binding protein [Desulfosarcina sp.]|nr:biotin/lipoyl-binding protein [Desulfosarcina sp.]MBC2741721.1 biotin/lipoyl-binding protein [Desulfosarcina sp.]MBC2764635.1 biotin/lipoyl-binding protein [Desulfosarcina sp.]
MKSLKHHVGKLLAAIPIALALLIVVTWVADKEEPQQKEIHESVRTMRVIKVPRTDLIPRAIGFGVAEPGRIWRAMAEVKGRVVEVHPELKSGAFISNGDLLIEIDSTEYKLAVAGLEAGIRQIRAQLSELDVEEQNTRASIDIEQRSLALAEQSLKRKQTAREKRAISGDEVDREKRTVLTQRQNIQKLKNTLALMPSERQLMNANLAVSEADLEQARLNLGKVSIKAPFDCRLAEVNIQEGQYLSAGESLFEALGIAVTEVVAQFRGEQLHKLFTPTQRREFNLNLDMEQMRGHFNFKVTVRYQGGDLSAEWDAYFTRIREGVDSRTRAVSVVVAVDRPYEKIIPGIRPPLSRGMFCEVELQAPVRPDSVIIPRSSLHDGNTVFLVDEQNRLRRQQVQVAFAQSNFYCLAGGLEGGETLIVSDPSPAITGMRIEPVHDDILQQRLQAEAQAREGLR